MFARLLCHMHMYALKYPTTVYVFLKYLILSIQFQTLSNNLHNISMEHEIISTRA